MESIEQEFAAKGVRRGSILLFKPKDALDMVRRCQEEGIEVLGLDGFKLTEQTIQPVMEQSIDLSFPRDPDTGWRRAESFLATRLDSDLYFEVVIATGRY
jgi:hypothetical protein